MCIRQRRKKKHRWKKRWPWKHVLKGKVLHLKKIKGEWRIFLCADYFCRVLARNLKFFTHLGKK